MIKKLKFFRSMPISLKTYKYWAVTLFNIMKSVDSLIFLLTPQLLEDLVHGATIDLDSRTFEDFKVYEDGIFSEVEDLTAAFLLIRGKEEEIKPVEVKEVGEEVTEPPKATVHDLGEHRKRKEEEVSSSDFLFENRKKFKESTTTGRKDEKLKIFQDEIKKRNSGAIHKNIVNKKVG